MSRDFDAAGRARVLRARMLLSGCVVTFGAAFAATAPAQAQFFWDQPHMSADDAAQAVIEHGFRPLRRPFRNDDVYVADVMDSQGRRERLIVSADSGDILQRFYVDRGVRRYGNVEAAPVPPGRIPNQDDQSNVFSRLFGGDQSEPDRSDPRNLNPDDAAPPPKPHVRHAPRVVERAPEIVRPSPPIESAPLAPAQHPATGDAGPPPPAANATASTPPASASPAPDSKPGRSIARDPLAIPGSREDDEKTKPSHAAAASAQASSAPAQKPVAPPASADAAPKPKDGPAAKSVPVAPLD